MKIWKFSLNVTDEQIVPMPKGSEILTVQIQQGRINLWARCSETAPKEDVRICIYGTGHTVPDNPGKYLGTVQHLNGDLVWHVYEDSRTE